MAPFPPSVRIWFFQRALDDIYAAYEASAKAHSTRPDEIEKEVRSRLGIGPNDPFPERDDDDEFDLIGRLYDDAGELQEQATRGSHLVRKAFLIALFHHWERFVNSSLKRAKYGHPKSWLKQQGREDCAKSILVLQKVANCAKHGPGNSCKELYRMRPDLFPRVSTEKEATENRLVIDGVELDKLFDAARKAAG